MTTVLIASSAIGLVSLIGLIFTLGFKAGMLRARKILTPEELGR